MWRCLMLHNSFSMAPSPIWGRISSSSTPLLFFKMSVFSRCIIISHLLPLFIKSWSYVYFFKFKTQMCFLIYVSKPHLPALPCSEFHVARYFLKSLSIGSKRSPSSRSIKLTHALTNSVFSYTVGNLCAITVFFLYLKLVKIPCLEVEWLLIYDLCSPFELPVL